jgi:hypothetical protein
MRASREADIVREAGDRLPTLPRGGFLRDKPRKIGRRPFGTLPPDPSGAKIAGRIASLH